MYFQSYSVDSVGFKITLWASNCCSSAWEWPSWEDRGALPWWRQLGTGPTCGKTAMRTPLLWWTASTLVYCGLSNVCALTIQGCVTFDLPGFQIWQMCMCLWAAYIQAIRGLLVIGLCLGLLATMLAFFGLECTHIGGDQRSKRDTLTTATAIHLLGCE